MTFHGMGQNCSVSVASYAHEPVEVFYGGEIKGESAVEYENEIGSSVVHSYEVTCKHAQHILTHARTHARTTHPTVIGYVSAVYFVAFHVPSQLCIYNKILY